MAVIWLTGESSVGKTTIAKAIKSRFGLQCINLDGDVLRFYFPNTGFDKTSIREHLTRVGKLAQMLSNMNYIVVCSFISPYADIREEICHNFIEVRLICPLEVRRSRDTNKVYKRRDANEISNVAGIDYEYEESSPQLVLDTSKLTIDDCVKQILELL